MTHLNGTGPEGKGPRTGRGLGKCNKNSSDAERSRLGKGLGKRLKSGGGVGKGKRLHTGSN